jgi:hypothetical protein
MEKEWVMGEAGCGSDQCNVRVIRDDGAQLIVSADDVDLSGDEGSFAERDGELDAPWMQGDVFDGQAAARVLLDAKETEEREQASAPVSCVGEDVQIEVRPEAAQIIDGDCLPWLADVGVAEPVVETGAYLMVHVVAR